MMSCSKRYWLEFLSFIYVFLTELINAYVLITVVSAILMSQINVT